MSRFRLFVHADAVAVVAGGQNDVRMRYDEEVDEHDDDELHTYTDDYSLRSVLLFCSSDRTRPHWPLAAVMSSVHGVTVAAAVVASVAGVAVET